MNKRIGLVLVDLPNYEQRALEAKHQPMTLSAIRSNIEKVTHREVEHMAVFLSRFCLEKKGSAYTREFIHQALKLKVELHVVSPPMVRTIMDPVDLALIDYAEKNAQTNNSLIIASSDGDFAGVMSRLKKGGVEVPLVYYSRPSRELLSAASHTYQIGFDPPWLHRRHKQHC